MSGCRFSDNSDRTRTRGTPNVEGSTLAGNTVEGSTFVGSADTICRRPLRGSTIYSHRILKCEDHRNGTCSPLFGQLDRHCK